MSVDPAGGPRPAPGPGGPAPGGPGGGMQAGTPVPAAGSPGIPPAGTGGAAPAPDGQRGRADGRSYTDARNQVGTNFASQYRVENEARADFQQSQIKGSVYTNSTIYQLSFGQGAAQVRASQINAEDLTAPFVPSTGAERLAETIADYPFLVLFGQRGYGKRATLLWALRRQAHDDTTMLYLDPSTDLATFSCADMPEHAVMIMQDVPDGTVDRLGEHAVKRIEAELRAGNRRLAITTTRAAAGATHSNGFLAVELATRPEPRQVFNRHLAKLLLGTGLARADVLAWEGVDRLVAEFVGPDSGLGDAARLARLLSRADRNDPGQAAIRVRVQMTEYVDEEVAQWFRKLGTLKARCMAISLAVLNGQSRELIAHEAAVLERRIMPAPDAPNVPSFIDPLDQDAAVSPALLDARVTSETQMTDYGPIVVYAMSYRERGYPGQVLQYVWRTYDGARSAIVSWLRDLGVSPDLAVRVRAATAAGVLACNALDYVHNQVISRWATDNREVVRNSAAIALAPPAESEVLRPTVRSLVDDWAREDSGWRLRATAARAYGRTVGLSSPTAALRSLARLAEVDDVDLSVAVANSYCELILEGTAPLAVRVLAEVEQLAADRMRERQAAGRLTLVGLSYPRGAPPTMSEHEERLRDWPTLLVLALGNPKVAQPAARLWQLALNDREIGEMAQDSLDDWAETAERSSELRKRLVEFLQWVAAEERGPQVVIRRAQTWTHRDGRARATGRAVLAALGY